MGVARRLLEADHRLMYLPGGNYPLVVLRTVGVRRIDSVTNFRGPARRGTEVRQCPRATHSS